MLALAGTARRWEPKRLRLRLFAAAEARQQRPPPAAEARRTVALGNDITAAVTRLQAFPSG